MSRSVVNRSRECVRRMRSFCRWHFCNWPGHNQSVMGWCGFSDSFLHSCGNLSFSTFLSQHPKNPQNYKGQGCFLNANFPSLWMHDSHLSQGTQKASSTCMTWPAFVLPKEELHTHCSLSAWRALSADVSSLLLVSDIVLAKEPGTCITQTG